MPKTITRENVKFPVDPELEEIMRINATDEILGALHNALGIALDYAISEMEYYATKPAVTHQTNFDSVCRWVERLSRTRASICRAIDEIAPGQIEHFIAFQTLEAERKAEACMHL